MVTSSGCLKRTGSRESGVKNHCGVSGQHDPNGEVCFNISKKTTLRELTNIVGIDEEVYRKQNMHLSAGHVNAVEYCSTMFGMPKLDELLDILDEDLVAVEEIV